MFILVTARITIIIVLSSSVLTSLLNASDDTAASARERTS